MITVSTTRLAEGLKEATAFSLPDMNEGTEYLFNTVYSRLSQRADVRLSEIDFDAFETEDIASLNDLYENVFERNQYAADSIMSALRKTVPIHKAVGYV